MSAIVENRKTNIVTVADVIKETENHVFTIKGATFDANNMMVGRAKGSIDHKDGTHCGEFMLSQGARRMITLHLDLNCKELLADLLAFLQDIDAMATPVEEVVETPETPETPAEE